MSAQNSDNSGKPDTGQNRDDRLAAALRDNLKRRKAQARGRRDTTAKAGGGGELGEGEQATGGEDSSRDTD